MSPQVIAAILKLAPLLLKVLEAALKAKDPADALVKAAAAVEMAAIEKARGAAVRKSR